MDTDHRIAEDYGAWGPRERDGQTTIGMIRSTVIIGADGRVEQIFSQVSPVGHSKELLAALT